MVLPEFIIDGSKPIEKQIGAVNKHVHKINSLSTLQPYETKVRRESIHSYREKHIEKKMSHVKGMLSRFVTKTLPSEHSPFQTTKQSQP